jgi:tetratricopeptide (TPR) repeat protein
VTRAVQLACALIASAAGAQAGKASLTELDRQVHEVDELIKQESDRLRIVETQYTERPEPTDEEARLRRFSDGEIQFLLGDYQGASVLFYDLVADSRFKSSPRYGDALFYLADALNQQKNYLGAKVYLRDLLKLKGSHYKEALIRYLELAGKLNDFTNIDEYINQARGLSGELPPEIAYVYGKWLFKRGDLPVDDRVKRATGIFRTIAANSASPYRLQAKYFIGVGEVKMKDLEAAAKTFTEIATGGAVNERETKVRELSNLSLGRILYESGKYDAALDRYQEIPRESEYFVDSLYEIAWTQVKKGEFERAKNATDIMLLVAPDSTLAPEAQILQGHLLLKLQRYDEASDTYNGVINSYGPVYEEIRATIENAQSKSTDPAKYFDELLARSDKNLSVAELLPDVARKWATTERDVRDALQMATDLESGKRGVVESNQIAEKILRALDERGLETFPVLQAGYTRADAVDSALTQVDQSLIRIEGYAVGGYLSPEKKAELEKARTDQATLKAKFESLPKSDKEVEDRRKRMEAEIDRIDRDAFKAGYEVQSFAAQLTAIRKFVDDTRAQRKNTREEEKAFVEKVKHEEDAMRALQKELDEVRAQLAEQRNIASAAVGGENEIRKAYEETLRKQHEIIAEVETQLPPDVSQVLTHAHQARERADTVRGRVIAAKGKLRDQVQRRGKQIRDTVSSEQSLLVSYGNDISKVQGDARGLVGRITLDSFMKVRQQFYDLVLKADVGVVDVAFTRKQDKTSQIQKLSAQKDRELRSLDEEFKEVLKDVD